MNKHGILTCGFLLVVGACVLAWGVGQGLAQSQTPALSAADQAAIQQTAIEEAQKPMRQRMMEARQRIDEFKQAGLGGAVAHLVNILQAVPQQTATGPVATLAAPLTLPSGSNPLVDLNLPNYANSPNIRKFVDTLPGLGGPLTVGADYIAVATPDTTTYPGSDYYEIAVVASTQKFSADLPIASDVRIYVQLETPVVVAALAATANPSKHIALTYPGGGAIMYNGAQVYATDNPSYLGPVIIATKGRATRVKFINLLPTGTAGNLPLPVDGTLMGASMGPITGQNFTQNRATLHLHGGRTPWISDGTPHQWTVPVGDTSVYQKGASATDVPDMPPAGQGALTFYWTNEQSARLMFYHDHAWGITRLNVYAGEAAGYLIVDQVEKDLINGTDVSGVFAAAGMAPAPILPSPLHATAPQYDFGIPLVIQDRTWVNDATTPPGLGFAATGATPTPYTSVVDPLWYTWVPGSKGGQLWIPHEYVVNENIYDPSGITVMGRWDYGPWMMPPMNVRNTVLPSPSTAPEMFMDTPIVNGMAYPTVTLPPTAFRFRILNACNDRMLNLQLYEAEPLTVLVTNGGSGYTAPAVAFSAPTAGVTATGTATLSQGVSSVFTITNAGTGYTTAPIVTFTRAPGDFSGRDAAATATLGVGGVVSAITLTNAGVDYTLPPIVTIDPPVAGTQATATAALTGIVKSITVTNPGSGYTSAPTVTITDGGPGINAIAVASLNTEVKMVPASPNPSFPTWPVDGRPGGVPDPTTAGPDMWLIGNEGGFLANLAVVPAQPVDFDYNRKNATFGGVTSKALLVPPAVRADIVVDFSAYAGKTLILYNDAPAPMPLYDVRYDYFTGAPDQSGSGGAPTTPPGFGPNTRTVMQINIAGAATPAYNLAALQAVLPKAFKVGQDPIVVPESAYNAAYGTAYTDSFININTELINATGTAQPIARVLTELPGNGYATPPTVSIVAGGVAGGTPGTAGNPGVQATAVAGLNPIGGITLVTAGSGYTSPPAVTIGPPVLPLAANPAAFNGLTNGVQATAVATISGGVVTAISITEPGAGYTNLVTAPTITIAAPTTAGGVAATAQVMLPTLGTVGSIVLTNPGSGYMKQPQVFVTGGGGLGAQAIAMPAGSLVPTGKAITEGFDPDWGRIFAQLGSIPNPLTPNIGAGPVIGLARYIDPPSEVLTPEQSTLWRISHIGVDSHALHFHLFDVQVINRVDWANIVTPPYDEEIGWKDTIRTNPFQDILVAFKPSAAAMKLPFGLPDSVRLLDPSTPLNSTVNFLPIVPPLGVPAVAQISNVMTNFGWEYVFHCHLLGHEENDMMRPQVLAFVNTVPTAPSGVTGARTATTTALIKWTDPTPFNYANPALTPTTPGNPRNEVGFRIMRASGTGGGGTFTQIGTVPANATSYTDTTLTAGTSYRYQVVIWNAAGTATSTTVTVGTTVQATTPPAAPTNLRSTRLRATSVNLSWTRPTGAAPTGYYIERAPGLNATTGFVQIGTSTRTTYRDRTVVTKTAYSYRVRAYNAFGPGAYSNVLSVTTP